MSKKTHRKTQIDPFQVGDPNDTYEIVAVDCYREGIRVRRLQIIYKRQSFPVFQVESYKSGIGALLMEEKNREIFDEIEAERPFMIVLDRTEEYRRHTGLSWRKLHDQIIDEAAEMMTRFRGDTVSFN